jgi:hypothetical protein
MSVYTSYDSSEDEECCSSLDPDSIEVDSRTGYTPLYPTRQENEENEPQREQVYHEEAISFDSTLDSSEDEEYLSSIDPDSIEEDHRADYILFYPISQENEEIDSESYYVNYEETDLEWDDTDFNIDCRDISYIYNRLIEALLSVNLID